jgi:hypothetical protein
MLVGKIYSLKLLFRVHEHQDLISMGFIYVSISSSMDDQSSESLNATGRHHYAITTPGLSIGASFEFVVRFGH